MLLCCIILRNIDYKNPKCIKERSSYFFCGLEKDDFKRLDLQKEKNKTVFK